MKSPTGRIPKGPEFQNIPVRTELAKLLREICILEDPLSPFLTADYSDLELSALLAQKGRGL